jgi:hypothetical protein
MPVILAEVTPQKFKSYPTSSSTGIMPVDGGNRQDAGATIAFEGILEFPRKLMIPSSIFYLPSKFTMIESALTHRVNS